MAQDSQAVGHVGYRFKGRNAGRRTVAMRQDWLKKRIKKQHNLCALCGKPMLEPGNLRRPGDAATLDHIIALSRGGSDHWENSQATHFSCNQIKGAS